MAAAQVHQPTLQLAERLRRSSVFGLAVLRDGLGACLCLGRRAGGGRRYEALLVDGVGVAAVDGTGAVAGETEQPHHDGQHGQHPDEARRGPP